MINRYGDFGNAFGLGPFLSLFLFIPPVILSLKVTNKNIRNKWSEGQRKKYVTVSAVGSIALCSLFIFSAYIRTNRTLGEYVGKWGINGQGRSIIETLKNDATANLDDIRLIVGGSDIFASMDLAETLASNGDFLFF